MFPSSGAISAAPPYSDPERILTGGPPAAKRGDIGVVSLQDGSPSTASLPLKRTSPEAGFGGGVHGNNIIAQQSSSYVISDLSEWSHSWAMRKQKKNQKITINNVDGETIPLCREKNKLTVTGLIEVTMRTKNLKMNGMA